MQAWKKIMKHEVTKINSSRNEQIIYAKSFFFCYSNNTNTCIYFYIINT